MIYKDYYKDLGIDKAATAGEIKKAYRSLANKYHPDKTKGDKVAEEKFKDINEANEVLRDPVKRKKYDQFGADWKQYAETATQPGGFDWSKYARGNSNQSRRSNTSDSNPIFSDEGVNDFFEFLYGQKNGERHSRRNPTKKGADLEAETTLSFEEVYHGTTRIIKLSGQTIKVNIKPGIAEQQRLRIASKGAGGSNGGSNGDLFLNIKVLPHQDFIRKGNDLYCNIPVNLYTAVLGGKTLIKTMKGTVTITIPKGTQNGKELRLRGLGMPIYTKKNEYGNLFVKILIVLPENLNVEELGLFGKLQELQK